MATIFGAAEYLGWKAPHPMIMSRPGRDGEFYERSMPKSGNIPESFVDALESLAKIWLDIPNLDDFLASGSDYGFVSRINDAAEFNRQSRVL
jgi:hypothetical protein